MLDDRLYLCFDYSIFLNQIIVPGYCRCSAPGSPLMKLMTELSLLTDNSRPCPPAHETPLHTENRRRFAVFQCTAPHTASFTRSMTRSISHHPPTRQQARHRSADVQSVPVCQGRGTQVALPPILTRSRPFTRGRSAPLMHQALHLPAQVCQPMAHGFFAVTLVFATGKVLIKSSSI